MDEQNDLSDLLHQMYDLGFMFFPIWPNTKDPACTSWKKTEHHMSPLQVIHRIDQGSNYAMIPPEGVFAIDFDSDEAYQRGIEKASIIADSLTFKTPKGYHVLFVGDGVPQTTSPIKEDPKKPRSPKTFLGKGVDVRVGGTVDSAKGYIVGPGSTRDGKRYEYMSGDEILDAPPELIALLQKPKTWKEVTGQDSPVDAPTAPTTPADSATGNTRPLTAIERGKAAKKHWQALEDAQEGERNDTIARAACGLGSLYADAEQDKRDEIFAKLMDHAERLGDGDPAEIKQNRTTAENQWLKGAESPATRPNNSESEDTYRRIFVKFDMREFEQALDNLNISIRNHHARDRIEYFIEDDGSWTIPTGFRFKTNEWFTADNNTEATMMSFFNYYFGKQRGENVVGVKITETDFKQWVAGVAARNPIHPFRDWVNQCQIDPNLEGLTLENWLSPWLKDPTSPLNRWAQRAIAIGVVQNLYGDLQPCRVIPVLRGEKGIGKTTMVRNLIPKEFKYHYGQFFVQRYAEMVSSLRNKFVVEFSELDGLTDAKVTTFKAFIGNDETTARLSYQRNHLDYPITSVIIGTINLERCIPNDTAVRDRLVIMDLVKGPDPKDYLPDRLAHIYALAREAYEAGERLNIVPIDLKDEQWESTREAVIINQVMEDRLNSMDYRLLADWFTLTDFMRAAGLIPRGSIKPPPGTEKVVKEHLIDMGVGITRKDQKKKGGRNTNRAWYYQMSDRMKEIRDAQRKESGSMPPMYGYGVQNTTENPDEL